MMRSAVRRRGVAAGVIAAVMFVSACGGSDDSDSSATDGGSNSGTSSDPETIETGLVNLGPDAKPVQGGSITMAMYSEIRSLDSAGGGGSGTAGGSELAAIYDVLMRYDPDKGEYVPQMAKSLEANADQTVWTLKLRDGVKFSDGTPLDSAAVAFSINRHIEKNGAKASFIKGVLGSIDTPDASTVVFNLKQPWSELPWILSYSPGNIVSPTAVAKLGDGFAAAPVGAGPFTLTRFAPGEELKLTANENYWGGRPNLDELRFVTIGNAKANLDSLNAGQAQVAYLRDPEIFRQAVADKRPGYVGAANGGGFMLINNGVKGQTQRPGTDVRVRQAIVAAIDPQVVDQRGYAGAGLPGTRMFEPTSRWYTKTPGPQFDPEKAKKLLAEAKADGYDGKLSLLANNTTTDPALAVQALLNSVGFEVTLDGANTVQEMIVKVLAGDYDVSSYGTNILDEAPWLGLSTTFKTGSTGNQSGYSSAKMDELLDELGDATENDAKQAAIEKIQAQLTEDAPSIFYSAFPEIITWDKKVHGIVPTTSMEVLFDKAFIEK